jgi:hypothetical protein
MSVNYYIITTPRVPYFTRETDMHDIWLLSHDFSHEVIAVLHHDIIERILAKAYRNLGGGRITRQDRGNQCYTYFLDGKEIARANHCKLYPYTAEGGIPDITR